MGKAFVPLAEFLVNATEESGKTVVHMILQIGTLCTTSLMAKCKRENLKKLSTGTRMSHIQLSTTGAVKCQKFSKRGARGRTAFALDKSAKAQFITEEMMASEVQDEYMPVLGNADDFQPTHTLHKDKVLQMLAEVRPFLGEKSTFFQPLEQVAKSEPLSKLHWRPFSAN